MLAICSGDMVRSPWPMERLSVSPPTHFMWRVRSFHSGVGQESRALLGQVDARERAEAELPGVGGDPFDAQPVLLAAMVQKYTSQDCASPPSRSR